MIVEVHLLPPGGGLFFTALSTGLTLAGAAEAALAQAPAFDLSTNLAGLITAGAFTGLAFREEI